ncbi:MAG TPA: hypothetical protein VGQ83_13140 [Polyangia bacterium]|jgi:hypothetical protein
MRQPPAELLKDRVQSELKLHPRVTYQHAFADAAARDQLAAALPLLVPFGEHEYHDALAILDWDHRLPSRTLILRIYTYYDAGSAAMGMSAYLARAAEITRRDRFPEFDVPDYEGLAADEAYDIPVDLAGKVDKPKLVSEWRRRVAAPAADLAVELVRRSPQFKGLATANRSPYLGDLEAVGWCPPCEGEVTRWTVDVWYLTDFDGLIGRGFSFAVDPVTKTVLTARELLVRAAENAR